MPLTFPAHQGLILGVKLRWPGHVDATALCIGAAAPDLAYPLGDWMNRQSHTAVGLMLWSIPFAVVASVVLRRWAAPGLFACLPDLGPLRIHSYAVLPQRRPPLYQTVASVMVGAASHVLLDGFTHAGRWGANWLDLSGTAFTAPMRGTMSWARVLQYIGHVGGTLLFVVLLLLIAASGRLETWYGSEHVARSSATRPSLWHRGVFYVIAVAPTLIVLAVSGENGIDAVFLSQTVLVASLLIGGIVATRMQKPIER